MDKAQYNSTNIKELYKKKDYKALIGYIWFFIWEDDSVWSWIINIILAFVIIKFMVYPIIGLTLTTSHPIVAVVSGSMEHDGSFDDWWSSNALCDTKIINQRLTITIYVLPKK